MITIYYSKTDFTGLRNPGPAPVRSIMQDDFKVRGQYNQCPAYHDHLRNLYAIQAPFDYNLRFDGANLRSDLQDQATYDEFVTLRSQPSKLITLTNYIWMIPDVPSLMVSVTPAYLDSNGFTEGAIVVPGTFDVGRWPRKIECAFHMKRDQIAFQEGDSMLYVRLHTDEDIVFKQFLPTPRIIDYLDIINRSKSLRVRDMSPMSFFYDLIGRTKSLKAKMLEEARANVIS